jgi:hypothetical protein
VCARELGGDERDLRNLLPGRNVGKGLEMKHFGEGDWTDFARGVAPPEPAAVGVRSSRTSARQFLYKSEGVDVDIHTRFRSDSNRVS